MLVGKQLAGTSHSHLHLIQDQQQLMAVAQLPHPLHVGNRRDIDPPFTLDRFQHDGTGLWCNSRLKGCQIIKRDMTEAVQQRIKEALHLFLPSSRDRGHGPTMERFSSGNDAVPLRIIMLFAAVLAS